ncbi:ZIP zinc transporter-domain-containing protein [Cercophora newfieldiana]|uniref:ZIP zinc transporter-domain-containing protein n=1 Tax=Cercophora newfieldiana TaxID=92897 RepID=A0AA39Y6W4_9PEZI|nr:ZIP zinc transporter-domain-containing protein [Cercophora newfieldiana]
MNRPSRTEDDLEHPSWNQNPPFLAPDLTTRQDLNGITNARVQRSHSGAGALGLEEKHPGDIGGAPECDTDPWAHASLAMDGTKKVPFIAPKAGLGGEGHAQLFRPTRSQLWGWIRWVASVVVASTVVSFARDALSPSLARPVPVTSPALPSSSPSAVGLTRRQGSCAQSGVNAAEYDVPLHVGALLIVLGVSSFACGLPMLAAKFPVLRIPANFFFAVRHFGTGVLLATAFVHLLPTAFISLADPCLSSFWTTDYPPMPGAIALVGIFFVTIIEMVFSPARQFTPRTSRRTSAIDLERKADGNVTVRPTGGGGLCGHADVSTFTRQPHGPVRRESIEPAPQEGIHGARPVSPSEASIEGATAMHILTPEQQHKKNILQCMMLEVGILFHSVFIGMALSIAVGGDFVVLLIAIAFHQTFEGLALGSRIASIEWPQGSWQPWLMVLAYGCTTPIGQAIGLATHTLYSPSSEFGLILVGTMNAVSSGLLVFASLIELLAEDFLSDHSWVVMRGKRRVFACFLVLLGAILMSLVGAWA